MAMENTDLEAAIAELIDEMEGEQGDAHEILLRLQQLIGQMRATGMPVPDDLAKLERDLSAEFRADAGSPPGDGD
ncbi:MAG: hypothetical protein GEU92_11635 [Alphaproteobacteria bacterium]|nr:hypothetical protein [Alphaproteobacteria bacterium]